MANDARGVVTSSPLSGFFMLKGDIMGIDYSLQWKDPRWQKKRLEILERDNFKCRCCYSSDKMLAVHHSYYIKGRNVWEYQNGSLSTLCDDCHKDVHSGHYDVNNRYVYLMRLFGELNESERNKYFNIFINSMLIIGTDSERHDWLSIEHLEYCLQNKTPFEDYEAENISLWEEYNILCPADSKYISIGEILNKQKTNNLGDKKNAMV